MTFDHYKATPETALSAPPKEAYNTNGFPSPARDYMTASINLNAVLMPNEPCTFMARADGTALADYGIRHGDLLLIDRSLAPRPGNIVAVYIDGQFSLIPYPENPADIGSTARLWGTVTTAIHSLL